ncbi:hypothetical protein FNF29_00780 [Cafeteria roenbergensis]|uniref:3-methyl-2-oxobutanoate hydroxymethyltransferase n=1 Tax=Cafeteria roenbergensis TaxID=33653 RepID=A0A5A8CVG4_CAFRO|nr:hypothetical protein FNF31_06507 [Cafeteria roenbergensis]KAA0156669.1 hypothetical protein FNF29_00780 [Cafeteria roenbergensis]|eukprot:KAA0156669.1 hypothetical protein FNF29_00780 [Cafeteria roenbergensis]
MSFADIRRKVLATEAVTMLTCYDAGWASLLDGTVDMLLVGDSVANVCLGMESTRGVGLDAMVHHTRAVRAGARRSLVVADMPFGTYLQRSDALTAAARLMSEGGADAVKLEGGGDYLAGTVRALSRAGIPVVGHVGLLPQTAGAATGFRVQGQDSAGGRAVVADAVALANAGARAVVLEMVPDEVAAAATARLRAMGVATIGIGAGPGCSGQVLVLHDALGLTPPHARAPRFSRRFAQLAPAAQAAAEAFASANGMGAAEALQAALRGRAIVLDCVTTHGATLEGGAVAHFGGPANTTSVAPLLRSTGGAGGGGGAFSTQQELDAAESVAAWLARAGLGGEVLSPLEQAAARLRKLSVTCSLVAVAATAGVTNGAAVAPEGRLRAVVRALAEELVPVVRSEARRLRGAAGPASTSAADPLAWAADGVGDEEVAGSIMDAAVQVGTATSDNVCSLLASKRGGTAHELAATLGWACDAAQREGSRTPRLRAAMASLAAAAEALA